MGLPGVEAPSHYLPPRGVRMANARAFTKTFGRYHPRIQDADNFHRYLPGLLG